METQTASRRLVLDSPDSVLYFRFFAHVKCTSCHQAFTLGEKINQAGPYRYHLNCFKCMHCSSILQRGHRFFLMEEGSLVCEADYETVCNRLQGDEGSEVTGEWVG